MKIYNKKIKTPNDFNAKLTDVLKTFEEHKDSWPFMNKVDGDVVTDY